MVQGIIKQNRFRKIASKFDLQQDESETNISTLLQNHHQSE